MDSKTFQTIALGSALATVAHLLDAEATEGQICSAAFAAVTVILEIPDGLPDLPTRDAAFLAAGQGVHAAFATVDVIDEMAEHEADGTLPEFMANFQPSDDPPEPLEFEPSGDALTADDVRRLQRDTETD